MIKTVHVCDICDAEFKDLEEARKHTNFPEQLYGYKPGFCFEIMDDFPHYAVIIEKLQKPSIKHVARYEILLLPAVATFLPYQDTRVKKEIVPGDQIWVESDPIWVKKIPNEQFLADKKDIERWVKKAYKDFKSEISNKYQRQDVLEPYFVKQNY